MFTLFECSFDIDKKETRLDIFFHFQNICKIFQKDIDRNLVKALEEKPQFRQVVKSHQLEQSMKLDSKPLELKFLFKKKK